MKTCELCGVKTLGPIATMHGDQVTHMFCSIACALEFQENEKKESA